MSVSTILNWNFQSVNGISCLTGIIQSKKPGVFKSISEDEIISINSVARGLYIETLQGDFFCKYENIGVRKLQEVVYETNFDIIKDVCIFEKVFLGNIELFNTLLLQNESLVAYKSCVEGFHQDKLLEKLVSGLQEKLKYYDSIMENNSCRIFLNEQETCNSIALKIHNYIFIDDYARLCFRRQSLKITHELQNFKVSYLVSGEDIIILEIPKAVEILQFEKGDTTVCLQLLKTKGNLVKMQDSLLSLSKYEVV